MKALALELKCMYLQASVRTLSPRLPCGRYESRLTQCMQSMCTALLRWHASLVSIRLLCMLLFNI